jgi:hypothetical protein
MNGLQNHSFVDGKDVEQVKGDLNNVLRGQLVITVAGAGNVF